MFENNRFFNSNNIKIIAIILMIIDHIGLYMGGIFPENVNFMLRFIGRISMPIFAYFVAVGCVKTKNLKNFFIRMLSFAVLFKIVTIILEIINMNFFEDYYVGLNNYLNILFTYAVTILGIIFIEKISIKYKNIEKKNFGYLTVITIIYVIFNIIKFECGLRVPILIFSFYFIMKNNFMKKILKNKYIECICILAIIYLSVLLGDTEYYYNLPSLLSVILILLYNGERKTKKIKKENKEESKNIVKIKRYKFYLIYIIQHSIIYITTMMLLG